MDTDRNTGFFAVRAPLLPGNPNAPNAHLTGAVADYQRALAAGDVDAIVRTFEPDGYFREPSGAPWVHRGTAELHEFMKEILRGGGIGLEHATVTEIENYMMQYGQITSEPPAASMISTCAGK